MSEIKLWSFWRAVLAECLGMIIFIFVGLSAAVGDPNDSSPDHEIKVAFAFGLAFATLGECIGHISGAHLNPAITLGLVTSCHISLLQALFYMLAQMLGAVVGSAIVYGVRPEYNDSLGVNKLNGISPAQGFGMEFMLTLQLVLCMVAVCDKRRNAGRFAPLVTGFAVTLGHLAGISYTGCGINPARSFGPAIIQKSFVDHWVYWAGPLSAGVVAALLYNYVLAPSDESFREKARILLSQAPKQECQTEPLLEDDGDIE
ncbi:aquaporin-1-like [Archocentrus centrarchus]|uniref:aquaporin-1-like n=1 Tax=Archocentrus centrarchus TaxID=63155 RepID=UPI0011EA4710|nr:aquaporin-1-like [Archocentrus centrarchus]